MTAAASWYHVHHAPIATNGATTHAVDTAPYALLPAPPTAAPAPRRDRRTVVALGVFIVAMTAVHLWWLAAYRRGSLLLIDETGFASTAIENTEWLLHHGVSGLWHTYRTQQIQGPFAPMVAIPIELVFGRSMMSAWATVVAFGAVATALTYSLARTVLARGWALLAAGVVAATPVFIDLVRVAYVPIPSLAAFLACATAVARSDGMRRTRCAVWAGVFAGVTVLTRPMVGAYLPGVMLAPLVLLIRPGQRLQRAQNIALTAAVAAAVAATWLMGNTDRLLDYLVQGRDATNGGLAGGSGNALGPRAIYDATSAMWLPLTLLLGVLIVLGVVVQWRRRAAGADSARSGRADVRAGMLATAAWGAVVAINAPSTMGSWLYPMPLLVIVGVAAAAELERVRARQLVTGALLGLSALAIVAKTGLITAASEPHYVDFGNVGFAPLVDGRALPVRWFPVSLEPPRAGRGFGPPGDAWSDLSARVTRDLVHDAAAEGRVPVVLLSRTPPPSPVFHPWAFRLEDRVHFRTGLIVGQLVDDGVPFTEQLVRPEYGYPAFLLDFPRIPSAAPYPSSTRAGRAAEKAGFKVVRRYTMPDGRPLLVWFIPDRGPLLTGRPDPF